MQRHAGQDCSAWKVQTTLRRVPEFATEALSRLAGVSGKGLGWKGKTWKDGRRLKQVDKNGGGSTDGIGAGRVCLFSGSCIAQSRGPYWGVGWGGGVDRA